MTFASKIDEALCILAEEGSEVAIAVSKWRRFPDMPNPYTGETAVDQIVQEIGDFIALVDILIAHEFVTRSEIKAAALRKVAKLREHSGLFA